MKLAHHQISHLYELALKNFQPKCLECESLKARMEKHLGEKEVRRIKRFIKKRPY